MPNKAPFIAEIDKVYFEKYPKKISHVESGVLPDAYLGNFENAKVIFLALNPGFHKEDLQSYMNDSSYIEANRASLLQKADDFYVLNKEFEKYEGYKWWKKKLKSLIDDGISIDTLRKKIMCIQYFPYHSIKYRHTQQLLPSQEYSFHLVKKAIRLKKKIVLMRSEKIWLQDVPELKGEYMKLKNYRNPTVSRGNMENGEYEKIFRLLSE